MNQQRHRRASPASAFLLIVLGLSFDLSGCAVEPESPVADAGLPAANAVTANEKECLVRAMYFESNRSSDEGLLALGSAVMNRVKSGFYPSDICGVVGQKGQFAAGVLNKPMNPHEKERVEKVADDVLTGKRHPKIAKAMYFHMAGLHFHYPNMHYVLVAGGNAFYEKTSRHRPLQQSAAVPSTESSCTQTGVQCAASARMEQPLPK